MADEVKQRIVYAAALNLVIIAIGAFFYKTVEEWNWVDSIYFAVSTLTTVGFGDLHPTHSISRIFAIFYLLIGIPVMFYTITLLGAYSVEKRAYTRIFEKAPFGNFKKPKAKKLAKELEQLSEKMTVKMKQLEKEEEKLEKQANGGQIKRNNFSS